MNKKKYFYLFTLSIIFMIILQTSIVFCDYKYEGMKRTILIGGDNYFPPFEYVNENGVYKGFNVDLMQAIAIEMGLDIEIIPMPWYRVVAELQSGGIDAIQGMKYSPSREYFFDFSDHYLISSQAIFVKSDNKYIVDLEDLQGKKVVIQKNDNAEDVLKDIPNIEIIEVENHKLALNALYKGEVDAYVGNRLTGLYIIQKNNYQNHIKIVGEAINPQEYGMAVKKGDEALLHIFNEGLKRVQANGTYDKIYKKWFGEPIVSSHAYLEKILYFLTITVFISLFIIFIFYRWNYLLKKEVDKRTDELKKEAIFKEQTLNSIFSGLITFNNEGKVLWSNRKALRYLGVSHENLIGKHLNDTPVKEYIYVEDFDEVLKTGKEKIHIEKVVVFDNARKVFEYNIYPLVIEHNNIYGITMTFADITEQKMFKERAIVKDKLESLGRLTAGIAHEIRNPLTAIKAYVELIPHKYNNPDFREQIAIDVPEEIERLNNIINNLLDYARPRLPNKELCNVKEIISSVKSFFNNQIVTKGINVFLDIEKDLYIFVDKQQFKQIIINLLLNAIEAVEGVSNPYIRIWGSKDEGNVLLVIEDNGYGISQKDITKVFEPFFTTKSNGTGLGLAISYQFIKENGGEVTIESEEGVNTKIFMKFPYPEEKMIQLL